MDEAGIWVRLVLDDSTEVTGFVSGAESPNDFWTFFKTHLVRLEGVVETPANGKKIGHKALYVNRDRIALVGVLDEAP